METEDFQLIKLPISKSKGLLVLFIFFAIITQSEMKLFQILMNFAEAIQTLK